MSRLDLEFHGTTSRALSLDPKEFSGKSLNKITAEILMVLSDINPGVNFFTEDVVEAAEAILEANRG